MRSELCIVLGLYFHIIIIIIIDNFVSSNSSSLFVRGGYRPFVREYIILCLIVVAVVIARFQKWKHFP
jgi:hypothetical protein